MIIENQGDAWADANVGVRCAVLQSYTVMGANVGVGGSLLCFILGV